MTLPKAENVIVAETRRRAEARDVCIFKRLLTTDPLTRKVDRALARLNR